MAEHQHAITNADDGGALAGLCGYPAGECRVAAAVYRRHDHIVRTLGKTPVEAADSGLRCELEGRHHPQRTGLGGHCDDFGHGGLAQNPIRDHIVDQLGHAVFSDHRDQRATAAEPGLVRSDFFTACCGGDRTCRGRRQCIGPGRKKSRAGNSDAQGY
ncbi:hypothetical protein D9M68_874730 [compost metagenome]